MPTSKQARRSAWALEGLAFRFFDRIKHVIHYEIVPVAGARMSDLDLAAFAEFMSNFRNLDVSQFDKPSQHRLLVNLNLAIQTESIL